MQLSQILSAILILLAQYKKGRDENKKAGDPTDPNTGVVLSDQELADLMKARFQDVEAKANELLAKFGAQ
jgi:hypothetical protein